MRMYNGCPDSELQAVFDRQDALLRELRKLEPEAHCTYHPDGEVFQAHVWGRPLGDFKKSREAALQDAINKKRAP